MNREIKFRGKCSKTSKYIGEWVVGGLVVPKDIENNEVLIISAQYSDCTSTYHVDKETIGQFTGLKDMIGKDIYEGDIVRWPRDNRLYLIKFQSGGFYASVEEFNKGIYGGFPLYALTECEEDEFVCEVIGNIFDNNNLLEE